VPAIALTRPAVRLDICKIHKPIGASERHFSLSGIKKASDIANLYPGAFCHRPGAPAAADHGQDQSQNNNMISNSYFIFAK
jgi:hypothetical protein